MIGYLLYSSGASAHWSVPNVFDEIRLYSNGIASLTAASGQIFEDDVNVLFASWRKMSWKDADRREEGGVPVAGWRNKKKKKTGFPKLTGVQIFRGHKLVCTDTKN